MGRPTYKVVCDCACLTAPLHRGQEHALEACEANQWSRLSHHQRVRTNPSTAKSKVEVRARLAYKPCFFIVVIKLFKTLLKSTSGWASK